MSEYDKNSAGQIRRGDWWAYFAILTATFAAVLFVTASIMGALCATCGAVIAATKAAQMTTRAYRTRPTTTEPEESDA